MQRRGSPKGKEGSVNQSSVDAAIAVYKMIQPNEGRPAPGPPGGRFYVVGIGASAGGLEAFLELLHALPSDTGMAFVVVQHLEPNYESQLADILSRSTSKPVVQA